MAELELWEVGAGVELLWRLGALPGGTVVDFGCRRGWYSVAAARAVGSKGSVIAVDKDGEPLAELGVRSAAQKLAQLRTVHTDGSVRIPAQDQSVDLLLLFDVIQFFLPQERSRLYAETLRALKPSGRMALHAHHFGDDFRARMLKDVSEAQLLAEVEAAGLQRADEYSGPLCHGDGIEEGHVVIFAPSH